MHKDDFFDLLDQLSRANRIETASETIGAFARAWGLHHTAYLGFNLPTPASERPLLCATYSADWQKHYAQKAYVDFDPILRSGLGGILPVDWSEIDRGDPVLRKFFGEAQEFDVGSNGLSVPLRGRHGEFALFTVTWNGNVEEWRKLRDELLRDLIVIAWNFHASALRSCGVIGGDGNVRLPPREASCLRWKGLGKTDEDIGRILGISPHTVRFHLESSRARLNTTNTMHTVAKALSLGLINLSYEPPHLLPRRGEHNAP